MVSHGKLKQNQEDINHELRESLHGLEDFIPQTYIFKESSQKSIYQNLKGQLAFIKNAFQSNAGHLTANGVSYIRIAKSANTSISKAMLEKLYPALRQQSITETQINFLADVNTQTEVNNTQVFTVVRNPFGRLVSVYRSFFENDHSIYHDYLFHILPQHISFAQFVNLISKIPERLMDQHFKPQHLALQYYEKKKIAVKVFKLENPDALAQFLAEHSMQFPHLNTSMETYDYRSYYTPELLVKAHALYRDDISKFGYENTYEELQKYTKTVH